MKTNNILMDTLLIVRRGRVCLFAAATLLVASTIDGQENPQFPAADILQTGDLIWPKKPGAIVPYNSQPGEAQNSEAARWETEKEKYLAELRKNPTPTDEEKQRYSTLQTMTYGEFVEQYLRGTEAGQSTAFGTGNFSVGHVGIIQIQDGTPTVVEAMIGSGVRRLTYAEWTKQRPGELVWLARLKDVSAEKRGAVAQIAASYIGRPYLFWNFNLGDDTGFYCSKLAWLSIFKGAGFASDDNVNVRRVLWYSPKQLMRSPHLQFIVNPGNYGTD
jgi:uncharacterized protein YycO